MNIYRLVLVLFVLLLVPLQIQGFLGSGSYVDPYRISSCDEFQNITNDVNAHYVLVNNLYCDNLSIEYFNGSLDGFNHFLEVSSTDYLFDVNEGLIIDLSINFLDYYEDIVNVNSGHLINVKVMEDISPSIGTFSVPESDWVPFTTLPSPYNAGVVLPMTVFVDNEIYVVGGKLKNNDQLNAVKIFNVDSQTWRLSASEMLVNSSGVGVVHFDGKIYVIGRYGGSELQIYDIETDSWSFGADMPNSRFDFSAAALNNKIYVFGGGDFPTQDQNATKSLFIYDIETDSWSEGPNMPIARQGHYGVGVYEEKIYVFGGNNESWDYPVQVDVFDTVYNNWSKAADLPFGFAYHGVSVTGDHIYALGGYNYNNDVSGETLRYDPVNDSWIVFNDSLLKITEYSLSAGFFDLYATGGYKYVNGGYEISNIIYKLELEKPEELEIISPVSSVYANSELFFNVSLYEHISNITYYYNGSNNSFNESVNLSFENGSNTITVFGYDKFRGNVSNSVSFTVDNVTPYVENYSIKPLGVVKGKNVTFEVYGKGDLFANITYDNYTEIVGLVNGTNSYVTNNSFVGIYNITFFSNDSFGRDSAVVSSSFKTFNQSGFNVSNFVFNGTTLYYYNGELLTNIIDAIVDVKFKESSYSLFFNGVNLTNATLSINNTNSTEHPFILVVNSNVSFNQSTITINASNLSISSPYGLFKCDNFTNNTCIGDWYAISFTSSNGLIEFNTTSFSAFGLKNVPVVSSNPGSSGGRSRGSISSPVASCVSSWSCEDWGECVDGVQTRVCMVENLCRFDSAPEQSRSCVEEVVFVDVVEEEVYEEETEEISVTGSGLPTGYVVSFNLDESNSVMIILLILIVGIIIYYSYVIHKLNDDLKKFNTFDKSNKLVVKILADIMNYRSSNNISLNKEINVVLEGDELTILLAKLNHKSIVKSANVKKLKFVESKEYKLIVK